MPKRSGPLRCRPDLPIQRSVLASCDRIVILDATQLWAIDCIDILHIEDRSCPPPARLPSRPPPAPMAPARAALSPTQARPARPGTAPARAARRPVRPAPRGGRCGPRRAARCHHRRLAPARRLRAPLGTEVGQRHVAPGPPARLGARDACGSRSREPAVGGDDAAPAHLRPLRRPD